MRRSVGFAIKRPSGAAGVPAQAIPGGHGGGPVKLIASSLHLSLGGFSITILAVTTLSTNIHNNF